MAFVRKKKKYDAELDYLFDWAPLTNGNGGVSDWLCSGEEISSYTITADSGITVDSSQLANSNTSVQVWLSGGTIGQSYSVTCDIETNNATPRVDGRTLEVKVIDR